MDQTYDLKYDENKVGIVRLSRKGMFYTLTCRFSVPGDHRFRLHCSDGNKRSELGLCIRYGREFGMDRYLPVKLIGTENLQFYLMHEQRQDTFLPINSKQPFLALDRLLSGRFAVREGIKGICLVSIQQQYNQ